MSVDPTTLKDGDLVLIRATVGHLITDHDVTVRIETIMAPFTATIIVSPSIIERVLPKPIMAGDLVKLAPGCDPRKNPAQVLAVDDGIAWVKGADGRRMTIGVENLSRTD